MNKFKNKYRIPSARLKNYNYKQNGTYFVTICTKNREHFFGEIQQNQMQYSKIGNIAQKYWSEIQNHFPFVILDAWVVMPNHMHGILIFNKPNQYESVETPNLGVSTNDEKLYWKSGNLGVIINQYKRSCTIASRKINPNFAWQPRFYDHIIRNDNELYRISEYIMSNPQNWKEDDYCL